MVDVTVDFTIMKVDKTVRIVNLLGRPQLMDRICGLDCGMGVFELEAQETTEGDQDL